MILDALLQFSNADNLAQVAGTYNSLNVIDLHAIYPTATSPGNIIPALVSGQGARDIGIGDNPALKIFCVVTTTFTSGGAATLVVNLQGATDNGANAPSTFNTWWTSPTYALATLVQGARLFDMDMPRPPAGIAIPRFLRLTYVIGAATTTAGNVSAYIVLDRFDQMYQSTSNAVLGGYPPGVIISN